MNWSRTFNLDAATKPTWELIVLMILMLALETVGDLVGCVGPAPDHQACWDLCEGRVQSVGVSFCGCHPPIPTPIPDPS